MSEKNTAVRRAEDGSEGRSEAKPVRHRSASVESEQTARGSSEASSVDVKSGEPLVVELVVPVVSTRHGVYEVERQLAVELERKVAELRGDGTLAGFVLENADQE